MDHTPPITMQVIALLILLTALERTIEIRAPFPTILFLILISRYVPLRFFVFLFHLCHFAARRPVYASKEVAKLVTEIFFRDGAVDSPFPLWVVQFWRGFLSGLVRGFADIVPSHVRLGPLLWMIKDKDTDVGRDNGWLRRELAYWAPWVKPVLLFLALYLLVASVVDFDHWPENCLECETVIRGLDGFGRMPWTARVLTDGSMVKIYHPR
ncbi:hypothetical protein GGS21DRAFT_313221 [Xylaria nigripes]|nr:hypothetical protein GGS21DRAFT_313221 [Xylaria nigripes]